jgi:hypothetical protein
MRETIPVLTIEHDAALGITRYRVDGERVASVVPQRMSEVGQTHYSQTHEYAVYPGSGCGDRFYLNPADAHERARYLVAQRFPIVVMEA